MLRLLLDTHTLLWYLLGDAHLGKNAWHQVMRFDSTS